MEKMGRLVFAAAALLAACSVGTASAAEKVRVASSHKGVLDPTLVLLADKAGFFKDKGIEVEIFWTRGGSDTQQAVVSGSMDLGMATGLLGTLAAYEQGAPIEVISASMTGANDIYFYVRSDSPIQAMSDAGGKTVSFSRPGASSEFVADSLVRNAGIDAKMVAAGGPSATLTQVMSGQIDVGWSAVPATLEQVDAGDVRVIATGNDVPELRDLTVRVNIANRDFLKEHPDTVKKFLDALQETIDWFYSDPNAIKVYAEASGISESTAKQVRDKFVSKEMLRLAPIGGLEQSVKDAVASKHLSKPLTDEQMKDYAAEVAKLKPAS